MGFGQYSGAYSSRSNHGGKRYNNDMVAHVWAQQNADATAGQSGNGNFFFRGRTLYSYGTHFVVGFIMPDGVAFLNADSYSVSTSGHQSDAAGAVRHRATFTVAGLTDLAGDWKLLPRLARYVEARRRGEKASAADRAELHRLARRELQAHAESLAAARRVAPDAWQAADDAETAGAYLADLAGLPAGAWPRLQAAAAKAKADKAAREAKAERETIERETIHYADMSPRDWRNMLAGFGTEYNAHAFNVLARKLKAGRSLMLKAKRGKLASASRLAIVRERIKRVDAERRDFDAKRQHRVERKELRIAAAQLRNWRDANPASVDSHYSARFFAGLARYAESVARLAPLASLKASAAELQRGADLARVTAETEERRIANAEKAEQIRAWYAGAAVRVRFDADSGGAALRVRGDMLETSHGASVPLEHAVKAFRFIKLCRERNEAFHRNGRTIRVGHFQVDSISPSGDFKAGCHSFTWPEVEKAAKAAGVFDCPADAAAVVSSH